MPEIVEPVALIGFTGGVVVVGAKAIAEVVFERAGIGIAVGVVHGALERGGGVEILALEPLAAREEEGLHESFYLFFV